MHSISWFLDWLWRSYSDDGFRKGTKLSCLLSLQVHVLVFCENMWIYSKKMFHSISIGLKELQSLQYHCNTSDQLAIFILFLWTCWSTPKNLFTFFDVFFTNPFPFTTSALLILFFRLSRGPATLFTSYFLISFRGLCLQWCSHLTVLVSAHYFSTIFTASSHL